jgi:hypothetical protein
MAGRREFEGGLFILTEERLFLIFPYFIFFDILFLCWDLDYFIFNN